MYTLFQKFVMYLLCICNALIHNAKNRIGDGQETDVMYVMYSFLFFSNFLLYISTKKRLKERSLWQMRNMHNNTLYIYLWPKSDGYGRLLCIGGGNT